MQSNPKTTIVEAKPEVAEYFKSFYDREGQFSGFILGYEQLYFLSFCHICSTPWETFCGKCRHSSTNFNVIFSILDDADDTLLHKVIFNGDNLDMVTATMSENEVQKVLDNLTSHACRVTYQFNAWTPIMEDFEVKEGTSIKTSFIKMLHN